MKKLIKLFSYFSSISMLFSCAKTDTSATISSASSFSSTSVKESTSNPTDLLEKYDYVNLDYSTDGVVKNTYKAGLNNLSVKVNNNEDYKTLDNSISYIDKFKENDSSVEIDKFNKYDLSIPNNITKNDLNKSYNIIFYIHPGAWISGSKDSIKLGDNSIVQILSGNYSFNGSALYNAAIKNIFNNRYIAISLNHTLLVQETGHKELSVYRMLDEIDSCLNSAVNKLVSIGFNKDKLNLILAGASSGSHLAMLYAYSRANQMVLKPKAIINLVGPVSLDYKAWRQFKDAEKKANGGELAPNSFTFEETEPLKYGSEIPFTYVSEFNQYQTTRFINGMAGSIYSDDEIKTVSQDKINVDNSSTIAKLLTSEIQNSLSPVDYINENSTPIISLYGGKDQIIGINQYATLKTVLDKYNVKNDFFFEKSFTHYLGFDSITDTTSTLKLLKIYQDFTNKVRAFLTDLGL